MIPINTITQDRRTGKWCLIVKVLKPHNINPYRSNHIIEIDQETARMLIASYQNTEETEKYFITYKFNTDATN